MCPYYRMRNPCHSLVIIHIVYVQGELSRIKKVRFHSQYRKKNFNVRQQRQIVDKFGFQNERYLRSKYCFKCTL